MFITNCVSSVCNILSFVDYVWVNEVIVLTKKERLYGCVTGCDTMIRDTIYNTRYCSSVCSACGLSLEQVRCSQVLEWSLNAID